MRPKHLFFAAGILAAASIATVATAADLGQAPEPLEELTVEDRLEIGFAPYLWAAGLEGQVGVFGQPPADIDASFTDLAENLDMALMFVFDARKGNYGFFLDFAYINLSIEGNLPGPAATPVGVGVKSIFVTPMLYYRVHDSGTSSVDAMAGARIWHSGNDLAIGALATSDDQTWVDGTLGLRAQTQLSDRFYVSATGLIGGLSSDFMWDIFAGVGWEANDWLALVLGYRAMGVDYSNNGFVYDIRQHGPVLGAQFRF